MVDFSSIFSNFKINEYGNIIKPSNNQTITCGSFGDDDMKVSSNELLKDDSKIIKKLRKQVLGRIISEDQMKKILSQAFIIEQIGSSDTYRLRSLLYVDRYIVSKKLIKPLNQKKSLPQTPVYNHWLKCNNMLLNNKWDPTCRIELTYKSKATTFIIKNSDLMIRNKLVHTKDALRKGSDVNTHILDTITKNHFSSYGYYYQFINYLKLNNILLDDINTQNKLIETDIKHVNKNLKSKQTLQKKNPLMIKNIGKHMDILEDEYINNTNIIDDLENDKQMNIRNSILSMYSYNKIDTLRYYIKRIAIMMSIVVTMYYIYTAYTKKILKQGAVISLIIGLLIACLFILFI